MMKHEFESLAECILTDDQWTVVHHVYQHHPDIPDVGGKDVLARVWNEENGYYTVANMLDAANRAFGRPGVKDMRQNWCSTYEVEKGHIVNERGKCLETVNKNIYEAFKRVYPELSDQVEYWSLSLYAKVHDEPWPLDHRIAVFVIPGGSEGYYIHVLGLNAERHRELILVKTLANQYTAQAICTAINTLIFGGLERE